MGEEKTGTTTSEVDNEVSVIIREMFQAMDDVEATFHPIAIGYLWRLAEIVGVDPNQIPRDGREPSIYEE